MTITKAWKSAAVDFGAMKNNLLWIMLHENWLVFFSTSTPSLKGFGTSCYATYNPQSWIGGEEWWDTVWGRPILYTLYPLSYFYLSFLFSISSLFYYFFLSFQSFYMCRTKGSFFFLEVGLLKDIAIAITSRYLEGAESRRLL